MHCNRYRPAPLSRRELLKASGFGFGTFALNAMFAQKAAAEFAQNPTSSAASSEPVTRKAEAFSAPGSTILPPSSRQVKPMGFRMPGE